MNAQMPRGLDTPDRRTLARALFLTRAGLWWESLLRAFWPLATGLLLVVTALSFNALELLPDPARKWAVGAACVLFLALTLLGLWRFRWPRRGVAEARLDAALPGRPLSALRDRPALGDDEGALWQAHRAQMRARLHDAKPVRPDAGLARRDPLALRLVGLTAITMAVLFGSPGSLGDGLAALAPSTVPEDRAAPSEGGLAWEGWAEPPRYTGKPTVYLNLLEDGAALELPEGTLFSLRLYDDGVKLSHDLGPPTGEAGQGSAQIRLERSGPLQIGGRHFDISMRPDAAPSIALGPPAQRRADGRLIQPYSARDDFGLTEATAHITLDMDAIPRRFGLEAEPEPRDPVALKLQVRPGQPEVEGQLTADLKKHPWANLPVQLRLEARDGIGQQAQSDTLAMILPGRRFFDPLASALIELRRDILWSRENAPQSARLLRAMLWRPEGFVEQPLLGELQTVIAGLETPTLTQQQRDALAEALWRAAIMLEDGGLGDALERMRRAQDKLAQAMRRGASADEIARLMDELREATDAYTQMLAERGEDPAAKFDRSEGQSLGPDQIQKMMDDIQQLMNEGRMAEAQALLEQFNRMMESLQIREGEGEGGFSSRERMGDTLREQQELADRAFRQMQKEWMGQPGEDDPEALAEAQRQLRDDLGMQREFLPERGSEQGEAAGREMDRAGTAMREAEQALSEGDTARALDLQAEAIDALRQAIRGLAPGPANDSAPGTEGDEPGPGEADGDGTARGKARPRLDPLGRALQGQGGGLATGEPLPEGQDGDARAGELLDEIRRRLSEPDRPRVERDYLDRLLDRF